MHCFFCIFFYFQTFKWYSVVISINAFSQFQRRYFYYYKLSKHSIDSLAGFSDALYMHLSWMQINVTMMEYISLCYKANYVWKPIVVRGHNIYLLFNRTINYKNCIKSCYQITVITSSTIWNEFQLLEGCFQILYIPLPLRAFGRVV